MNLGFSQLIDELHAELQVEYHLNAVQWADRHMDGAWSKAQDRFDKALVLAIERGDFTLAKIEGDFYKATILDVLRKYKAAKNIEDTETFLATLRAPR